MSGVFFESRPVLCRIFGTPQNIKDRVERPLFFVLGTSFFLCEASGMASLRSQYSACGDAPPKARNTGGSARHFCFWSFGVRASTQYSACGDAPPKATNTGRSARHFFLSFGCTMSRCTLPKFRPKFVQNSVDFRPFGGGGTLREVSGRLWKPPAAQGRFVDILLWISVSFWGPIWTPFRHFWATFFV